jgi:predicted nucleic-acid-binding Zn-ribbon protein
MSVLKKNIIEIKMKTGIKIGKSKLYDVPNEEFDLIYCQNCDTLFNVKLNEREETNCHNCQCEIEIK